MVKSKKMINHSTLLYWDTSDTDFVGEPLWPETRYPAIFLPIETIIGEKYKVI